MKTHPIDTHPGRSTVFDHTPTTTRDNGLIADWVWLGSPSSCELCVHRYAMIEFTEFGLHWTWSVSCTATDQPPKKWLTKWNLLICKRDAGLVTKPDHFPRQQQKSQSAKERPFRKLSHCRAAAVAVLLLHFLLSFSSQYNKILQNYLPRSTFNSTCSARGMIYNWCQRLSIVTAAVNQRLHTNINSHKSFSERTY